MNPSSVGLAFVSSLTVTITVMLTPSTSTVIGSLFSTSGDVSENGPRVLIG